MAANFLTLGDFKGFYAIDRHNQTDSVLNEVLEEMEKYYLVKALGLGLYKLLVADLDSGIPQTERFANLVNGVEYTDYSNDLTEWVGLKKLLIPLCYYDLKKQLVQNSTKNGYRKPDLDNGTIVSLNETYSLMNERYNKGVNLWIGDFWNYMYSNKTVYPEWKYVAIQYQNVINEQ